jgi:acetyl-CoA carboxylase carboxyltransferase component
MPVDPGHAADEAVMARFEATRERVHTRMGGEAKIERIHAAGRRTVREHIAALVDPGSFREIGTFVCEPGPDGLGDLPLPGDGLIGGHATIGGRPVTVCGDDDTVRRGTAGPRGQLRATRLREMAVLRGNPLVLLGQAAGARLPENLQSHSFATNGRVGNFNWLLGRGRSVPVVSVIVGDSFGQSSFYSALSDFVVQLDGTCLALTSPGVVREATGEQVTGDELGGSEGHARHTGQIDARAASADEAYALARSFLSFLPSTAGEGLPLTDAGGCEDDDGLPRLVPLRRTRAYDVRRVIARLVDGGDHLEMKPAFSPNIVTTLARIGGTPLGIIANQPRNMAGSLTPDACLKATRLLCLCDGFGLPVLFLVDNPGFLVGTAVEHDRALARGMQLLQALHLSRVPKCTVILRKAFGLGFLVMGGPNLGVGLSVAWPGAEVGFMDPAVAARVLFGARAGQLPPEAQDDFLREREAELAQDFSPYGVASSMTIDEVIDPRATRRVVAEFLHSVRHATVGLPPGPLSHWPFWS